MGQWIQYLWGRVPCYEDVYIHLYFRINGRNIQYLRQEKNKRNICINKLHLIEYVSSGKNSAHAECFLVIKQK